MKEFLKVFLRIWPDGQDIVDIASPQQWLLLQSQEIFLHDDNRDQGRCHRRAHNNTTDLMNDNAIKLKYIIFAVSNILFCINISTRSKQWITTHWVLSSHL